MEYIRLVLLIFLPFAFCFLLLSTLSRIKPFQENDEESVSILLSIKEKNLDRYVDVAFKGRIKSEIFQLIRLLLAIVSFISICFITDNYLSSIVIAIVIYMALYLYVKYLYEEKIKRINILFPYYMKNVLYFCYSYPVNNAFIKSLDYVDDEFKESVERLIKDVDVMPLSYTPYQSFIDSFDGRIKNADFYFKTFYSLSNSKTKDGINILNSLNQTISDDLNSARKQKNDVVNDTIGYIGLMPVILLVIVLTVILFISINYI